MSQPAAIALLASARNDANDNGNDIALHADGSSKLTEYSFDMEQRQLGDEDDCRSLCWSRRCAVTLCSTVAVVVATSAAVGLTYGCLVAHMLSTVAFDIDSMQIERLHEDNASWSAGVQLTLWCNTSGVGSTVRVSHARVRAFLDGEDVGTGEFGPITIDPNTHMRFSGAVEVSNRPIAGAQLASKLQAGEAVKVTADIEQVTIWGVRTQLSRRVRVVSKVIGKRAAEELF
eukprot:m51a1_g14392 hypothetical protein (231) ;mRNA; f:325266-326100